MALDSNTQPPSSLHAESESKIKTESGVGLRRWRSMKRELKIKDWRRVAHSAKVGLALALVSLSVLLEDVFDKLGQNAIWAILTVVVVFEYTVGATLSKGLNRGLGTIMAAAIGLSVDYMANFTGPKVEPFVVGFSVFVIGMMATYTRFVPTIKAKYDYGVVIFLVTFCLVVISGYRVSNNIHVVFDRVVTIMLGVAICFLVSTFIFPIWAGDDLNNLVIQNFEGLANSLEGCLKEYFQGEQKLSCASSKIWKGQPCDDKIYKGYREVLISKQTEESLANFASWEPRRGYFGCMYPWKHLVEVGAILRHCAYTVAALHGCVLSEIQAPESLRQVFATSCIIIGEEVSGVLRGVACDLKAKKKTKIKQKLLYKLHLTIKDLNYVVQTYPHFIYASRLQIPNPNYNNSICIPNPNSKTNYVSWLQEPTGSSQSPLECHDLQIPSCLSPSLRCRPSINQAIHLSPFLDPSLNHVYNSHVSFHSRSHHVIPVPNFSSHIDVDAYPPPQNPNPDPKILSDHKSCSINIEVPDSNEICTSHSSYILNSHPNSNFQGDKESSTPHILPPTPTTNAKGDNQLSFMLHESMEFAKSLSLASLITLLIEIVARVEHLLDAVADFQDKARFKEERNDKETPCVDKKVEGP